MDEKTRIPVGTRIKLRRDEGVFPFSNMHGKILGYTPFDEYPRLVYIEFEEDIRGENRYYKGRTPVDHLGNKITVNMNVNRVYSVNVDWIDRIPTEYKIKVKVKIPKYDNN